MSGKKLHWIGAFSIFTLALLYLGNDSVNAQSVPKLDFDEFSPLLHQQNDTTYVINFWATWCAPCIKELPAFERLHKESQSADHAPTKVVLVSLDFPDHYDSALLPFIENKALKSKVIFLDDGRANKWIPKVSDEWSGAIPATLIYRGKSRWFHEGSLSYSELVKGIQSVNK